MISECIALLSAGIAFYAVHAATTRERTRWTTERRDRRRERLLLLYADWSSHLLETLSLRAQLSQRPPIDDEQSLDRALRLLMDTSNATRLAMRELNRASFAIVLEEGAHLASEVNRLTHAAQSWPGVDLGVAESIRSELGRLVESKRISYQPKE